MLLGVAASNLHILHPLATKRLSENLHSSTVSDRAGNDRAVSVKWGSMLWVSFYRESPTILGLY